MQPLAGTVFVPTADSGEIQIGFPGESGFGTMVSGALEQSTVDLASELTTMIEAERNYTANSKVFQTGSELMEVLVNLKR
jgi:flagellar hook protein FlgE